MREERLRLMGMQHELKMKSMELVNAAKSHISAIKDKLALAALKPIDEIDSAAVLYHAQELYRVKEEHRTVSEQMSTIEKELA
jgi:hypothetical protein